MRRASPCPSLAAAPALRQTATAWSSHSRLSRRLNPSSICALSSLASALLTRSRRPYAHTRTNARTPTRAPRAPPAPARSRRNGGSCNTNWYEGNAGGAAENQLGRAHVTPRFEGHKQAPALLGFDETIDAFCWDHGGRGSHAIACVHSGFNILSLYGERVPYNICRNLEWQARATHTHTRQMPPHTPALTVDRP